MSGSRIAPVRAEKFPAYYTKKIAATVTRAEWREYAPLTYEVTMLEALAKQLKTLRADGSLSDQERCIKNALIESFGIHFRNLAAFLWPVRASHTMKTGKPRQPKPTDVIVRHFTPGWFPSEPAKLEDLITRVSREIAHLTTQRLSGTHQRKRWDPSECLRALRALGDFVRRSGEAGTLPRGLSAAIVGRLLRLGTDEGTIRVFGEHVNATTHLDRLAVIDSAARAGRRHSE